MSGPKQTGIEVELIGSDGNVFALIEKSRYAMRRGGVDDEVIDQFVAEVTSSDSYDAALSVIMDYVEVY